MHREVCVRQPGGLGAARVENKQPSTVAAKLTDATDGVGEKREISVGYDWVLADDDRDPGRVLGLPHRLQIGRESGDQLGRLERGEDVDRCRGVCLLRA